MIAKNSTLSLQNQLDSSIDEGAQAFIRSNFSNELELIFKQEKERARKEAEQLFQKEVKEKWAGINNDMESAKQALEQTKQNDEQIKRQAADALLLIERLNYEINEETFILKNELTGIVIDALSDLIIDRPVVSELLKQAIDKQLSGIDDNQITLEVSQQVNDLMSDSDRFSDVVISPALTGNVIKIVGKQCSVLISPENALRNLKEQFKGSL